MKTNNLLFCLLVSSNILDKKENYYGAMHKYTKLKELSIL
jgi:hypothetical protein